MTRGSLSRIVLRVLITIYAVLWLGAIANHILNGGSNAGREWAPPAFLLIASSITLIAGRRDLRGMAAAFGIGLLAEMIGVLTGFPFGPYRYSTVLGPSLASVPIVMAGAWMILIGYVRQMGLSIRLAAMWMACIDLIIEPLAANQLAFWRWQGQGIWYGAPYTNFIGWYLVSVVILHAAGKPAARNSIVFAVGLTIQLFFTVLAVIYGLYPAVAVGVALCALGLARWMMLAEA